MLSVFLNSRGLSIKKGWLSDQVCGEQPELGDIYLSTPCVSVQPTRWASCPWDSLHQ
ncbi:MAG: hypothetical protein ACLVL2_10430 [Bacteroides cellulosilyticus]